MQQRIDNLLNHIEKQYGDRLQKGSRHYLEVSLAEQARTLGYANLVAKMKAASAIIPLKRPQPGMKVRIDGRTFVNYAQYESGMAVPGYVARSSAKKHTVFVPQDSMVCNFC